ncbi:MAG TPA: hypothetical protein VGN00_12180 [Puia sp.]|jgi:hypothetical protein
MRKPIVTFLKIVCGTENGSGNQINRANLFALITALTTIILLVFTYSQIRDVKETNSADFALKLKSEIFSKENLTLISLLDDSLVKFVPFRNYDGYFELDTQKIKSLPSLAIKKPTRYYTLVQVDQLLMAFENLSFYEKKDQIDIDYIYEQFAYYITAVWKNGYIQQYIDMTRGQPSLRRAYINFEELNAKMVIRLRRDSLAAVRHKSD